MKKMTKLVTLAMSFVLMTFAGCNNMATGSTVSGGNLVASEGNDVTITIAADEGVLTFPTEEEPEASGNVRTITSDSLKNSDIKFYLVAEKIVGNTRTVIKPTNPIDFKAKDSKNPNEGTVTLKFAEGYYDFTLYGIKGTITNPATADYATNMTDLVLIGRSSADLRNNDRVHFYMTPTDIVGDGKVTLDVYADGWDLSKFDSVTATIDIAELGTGTSKISGPKSLDTFTNTPKPDFTGVNFGETSIGSGTYNLIVDLSVKGKGSSNTVKFTWSDKIIVLANQVIQKHIAIPDIVEDRPAAPTNFTASYKNPAYTDDNYYQVMFEWKDNSSNEEYFNIELLPIKTSTLTSAINADTKTPWDPAYMSTISAANNEIVSYGKEFYGNDSVWVDGSLQRNNTHAIFKLELGKRYLARITAVNSIGKSDPCYIDFVDYSAHKAERTDFKKFTYMNDTTETAYKVINLFRLTYNLNGGTLKYVDPSKTDVTGKIVEYRTVSSSTSEHDTAGKDKSVIDIIDPINDITTIASLISENGNSWTGWKVGNINGDKYPLFTVAAVDPAPAYDTPADYVYKASTPGSGIAAITGYTNLDLYANYMVDTADVTTFDPNVYNITLANVKASGIGVDDSKLKTKGFVSLNLYATNANEIGWTIYGNPNSSYDKMTLTVRKTNKTYNLLTTELAKNADSDKAVKIETEPSDWATNAASYYTDEALSSPATAGAFPVGGVYYKAKVPTYAVSTPLSTFSTGKYMFTFSAYTSKYGTQPFTCPVIVEIVEGEVVITPFAGLKALSQTNYDALLSPDDTTKLSAWKKLYKCASSTTPYKYTIVNSGTSAIPAWDGTEYYNITATAVTQANWPTDKQAYNNLFTKSGDDYTQVTQVADASSIPAWSAGTTYYTLTSSDVTPTN